MSKSQFSIRFIGKTNAQKKKYPFPFWDWERIFQILLYMAMTMISLSSNAIMLFNIFMAKMVQRNNKRARDWQDYSPPRNRVFDSQTNSYVVSDELDLEIGAYFGGIPDLLDNVASSPYINFIREVEQLEEETSIPIPRDPSLLKDIIDKMEKKGLIHITTIPEPLTPDFWADAVTYESLNYLSDAESSNLNYLEAQSPLDQFSIHPILDLNIGNFFFSFTNLSLSMLLTLGLVLLLVFVVTKKGGGKSVPNAWQSLVELIYDFVPNLVNEQIGGLSGNVKQKFFPCISVTFTFSLFRNPQGMIPFSFTVTSHFLITLALSFSIFIGITIVGFQRHGLHFFSFLLPAGVPLPLAPFLVLLELISHCFRALSSGIRLFANMMAGHSSVKILSGFAWTMLFLNNIFYFIGDLGPLFIVLALTGLELGVAISQAHVSTISICIYLNDATNLHQNE
uniref:ATP synthase subunit a n=1 Tax=Chrysopogon zizanioides TaxID=167337 RepID=A0A7T3V3S8_9POAL|nr:ATPase subunit 6 [Chrysopogon zizanioides]QPZ94374.1 ATPase subunit 6 [Chrysopogon zizanioides]